MAPTEVETPAIAGGKPAKGKPFRKEQRYGDEELRELKEAIEQQTLFYALGKKVKQFEAEFAEATGFAHGVSCSSGTTGIHAALIAAGVSPGDEVIVPPITDMGSVVPIMFQGAIPVFADLDETTANLLPASVEENVTDRTRAIIAVHLAGNPCDLDAIRKFASKRNIAVIEDCAQAHGARYNGKAVGSFGLCGCYSFNEFKHVSCGDGGIVVTNDGELARKLRLATDKAYSREPGVTQRAPAFLANNYRMTELQGAVAIAQTRKLKSIVERRRSWCGRLTRQLEGLKGLMLPRPLPGGEHSYWFYMMRVIPDELGANADEFCQALKAEGLPVSAHYIIQPVYEYPLFTNHSAYAHGAHPFSARQYKRGLCPNAEKILDTCINLAINEAYSDEDLEQTVRGITRVARWFTGN